MDGRISAYSPTAEILTLPPGMINLIMTSIEGIPPES